MKKLFSIFKVKQWVMKELMKAKVRVAFLTFIYQRLPVHKPEISLEEAKILRNQFRKESGLYAQWKRMGRG